MLMKASTKEKLYRKLFKFRHAQHHSNDVSEKTETTRNVGQCPTWWSQCQI